MQAQFREYQAKITNPFRFKLFMLGNLPAAFFAGLHLERLDESIAVISIKQKWFNKNPFRSIYFAILSMAAEVSTGVLCMGAIYKRAPSVSMLVTKSEGVFHKKATGTILFTCNDGKAVHHVVEDVLTSGDGKTITCYSKGTNEKGEVVAEFYFTWSFKTRAMV